MRTRRCQLVLALPLVFSCSCVDDDGGEDESVADSSGSESSSSDTDPSSESTSADGSDTQSETDTSTDSGTDTDMPGGPLCASAGWLPEQVVALITDRSTATASLLRADGSTIPLDTSLPGAAPDAVLDLVVDAEGEYVFVAVYDLLGPERNLACYRVYKRDSGAIVWEYVDAMWEPGAREPHLGADGRVALHLSSTLNDDDNGYSQVIADGESVDLFVGYAAGPVAEDGWLPIDVGENYPSWRNITSKASLNPAYLLWLDYASNWLADGTLAYLAVVEGSMALVEQRADASLEVTPWPELDPYLFNDWSLSRSAPNMRWLLISNDSEERLLRLLEGDVSEERVLLPPPGTLEPECSYDRIHFDQDDRLLMTWRDAGSTRVWTMAGPDDPWEPLTELQPIADNTGSDLGTSFGSYWLRGFAAGENSCFIDWQDPPPEALLGSSLQIVRPADGTAVNADYGASPALTAEGRCAARPLSAEPQQPWRIDDLVSQQWVAAPQPGTLRWLDD